MRRLIVLFDMVLLIIGLLFIFDIKPKYVPDKNEYKLTKWETETRYLDVVNNNNSIGAELQLISRYIDQHLKRAEK